MSSSTSRKLKQNRRYQRTQVTITSGSNLRFQNSGGRRDFIPSTYQIRRCNPSGNLHFPMVFSCELFRCLTTDIALFESAVVFKKAQQNKRVGEVTGIRVCPHRANRSF